MQTIDGSRQQSFRAWLWAGLLVFLTCGYFQNPYPGWNVNSQWALTLAIVEQGTLSIDDWHDYPPTETGDKAYVGGRFYSDKSPVTPLLGVPPYAFWRLLALHGPLELDLDAARHFTTWLAIGGAAALLAALLTTLLIGHGVAPATAARAAALWIAATPLLGYAILFYNYLPACALALGGFLLVRPSWAGRPPLRRTIFLAGLLFGLATWTLNTMALAALIVTVLVALAPRGENQSHHFIAVRIRRLWPWVLGGLLGIAGHFIYVYAIFGTFGSPYAFEYDDFFREQMQRGLMGATIPRPWVAWLITFHPFMGIFTWFPLVLLAVAGCLWLLGRGGRIGRFESIAALALLTLLLLYASAYFMWWGGRAYAPRHLIPALALLAVGLAPLLRGPSWLRLATLMIGLAGALLNLGPVALDPQPWVGLPQEALLEPASVKQWPSPMLNLLHAVWLRGAISPNWGTRLGLQGPISLLPLVAIWTLFWLALGPWLRWKRKAAAVFEN